MSEVVAESVDDTSADTTDTSAAPKTVNNADVATALRARLETSKTTRRAFHPDWKYNVDRRLGKIAVNTSGVDAVDTQAELNPDWALTKTKTANLYSQVPQVQATHENTQYAAAVSPFMKQLNYEIGEKRANVGVAMEEVLNDVVNAAGIGYVVVGYAARFVDVEVPAVDVSHIPPEQVQMLMAAKKLPTTTVPQVVSDKIFVTRGSPTGLLWPSEFVGSNFDDGDFIGYSGKTSWAEAKNDWKLTDADKDTVLGSDDKTDHANLQSDVASGHTLDQQVVTFDELYYWRYRVDPDEKSFSAIWKIVFVHGKDTPVVHEAWTGQKYNPQTRKYVGACKFPVRVSTLTYVTDNPVPPSDSAAGRPQVNDLRRSRSQMFQNRDRSTPIRWFDVNRVDTTIQDALMRGTFQGFIPTNGDGNRMIGEIARASYPAEDLAFDQASKADLMESWQVGPNQMGTEQPGRKTGAEAGIVQQNFATRIGQERGKFASFFLGVCEVVAGLMALHSDFSVLTVQEKQAMQQVWDEKSITHDLVLKIRPDSTIALDVQSQLKRLTDLLNMTAKSGYVNVKPLIMKICELSGEDPAEIVVDPQPKKPEDPNISYRFTGKDDLMNPVVVAMLIKAGQAPSPEELAQAVKLLLAAQQTALQPPAPPGAVGPTGAPDVLPPTSGGPSGPPQLHPQNIEHPDWSIADRIAKRSRDLGGG